MWGWCCIQMLGQHQTCLTNTNNQWLTEVHNLELLHTRFQRSKQRWTIWYSVIPGRREPLCLHTGSNTISSPAFTLHESTQVQESDLGRSFHLLVDHKPGTKKHTADDCVPICFCVICFIYWLPLWRWLFTCLIKATHPYTAGITAPSGKTIRMSAVKSFISHLH